MALFLLKKNPSGLTKKIEESTEIKNTKVLFSLTWGFFCCCGFQITFEYLK